MYANHLLALLGGGEMPSLVTVTQKFANDTGRDCDLNPALTDGN